MTLESHFKKSAYLFDIEKIDFIPIKNVVWK